MKTKLTLALVALLTGTVFGSMPAAMPEFKNAKQLAEWRAEVTAQSVKEMNSQQEHAFYTGKPYVEASGGYAFRYRSYSPELARWTSEDPSGFPDGANACNYICNTPTFRYDYMGLSSQAVIISLPWTTTTGFLMSAQWEGTYNWDMTQNHETSSIDMNPGLTGDLPVGTTVGGFTIGYTFDPVPLYHSDLEYRTTNGFQEKRYTVDLKVDIYKSYTGGRELFKEGIHLQLRGNWYE